jgi:hypothetical protein
MNLGPQLQPTGVNVHETCFILENRLGNGWLAGNLQPSATWHLGRPPRRLAMVALASVLASGCVLMERAGSAPGSPTVASALAPTVPTNSTDPSARSPQDAVPGASAADLDEGRCDIYPTDLPPVTTAGKIEGD